MKIKLFRSLVIALILFTVPKFLVAQMWEFEKTDVESLIWDKSNYIDNKEFPENWQNSSAIIIEKDVIHELKETSLLGVGHTSIIHNKVKILDQAALENYSEFYFDNYEDKYIYIYNKGYARLYDSQKNFFGFRVIKPDGSVIIIDAEKEMITEKDGNNTKRKIAIPSLQIGDILDYYIYRYGYAKQGLLKKTQYFFIKDHALLQSKYPISNLNFEIITDKNCKVELLNLNGTEIKEEESNGEYKFIISAQNLEGLEKLHWDYVYRTRPSIKVNLSWESNFIEKLKKEKSKYYSVRELDNKIIKEKGKGLYDADISGLFNEFQKYLKKNKLEKLSLEKKVEEYYYFLRHRFVNMHLVYDRYNYNYGQRSVHFMYAPTTNIEEREISHYNFCQNFIYALNKYKISYDYLLTVPRQEGDISEILGTVETFPILKINLKTPTYIYFDGKYSKYNILPESIEGVNCLSISKVSKKGFIFNDYKMPTSKAENNLFSSQIDLKLNDQSIDINGQFSVKGQALSFYHEHFLSIFDFVYDENIKYGTKRWGDTTLIKDGKIKDKIIQMNRDDKISFKENFTEYAKNYFEVEELILQDVKKTKLGLDSKEDAFELKYNISTKELVNKIGNNYVIKIGKLTGEQFKIKEDELKREYDVYVPYPKKESHKISFTIPEKYEVKGIENLNTKIENQYGSFESKAIINNNILTLECTQIVSTNFIKAEDWSKLVDILNAAFNTQQKEILLKQL